MPKQLPVEKQISRAVAILKKGGLVAYPTDTVYGLGADPLNAQAVAGICHVPINRTPPIMKIARVL